MRSQSVYRIVRKVYNSTVRPHLPRTYATLNGVDAPVTRLLDISGDNPDYEAALVDALDSSIDPSDTVVIVGAGYGVTTVHAAQRTSDVMAYEAGSERVELARMTLANSGVPDDAEIIHAAVGPPCNVDGEVGKRIDPADVPDCDVLELDCEGAELNILRGLDQRPRVLIVETHPMYGCETRAVCNLLVGMGYHITDCNEDDADNETAVLTAKQT